MQTETHTLATKKRWPATLGWGVAVLLVIAAWAGAYALRGGGEKVVVDGWADGLEAGQVRAAEADRPMVVLFTAGWCGPCQKLKRDVLAQPEAADALQAGFVPVQVDLTDRSPSNPNLAIAQAYGVRGIPTVIAMSPDGKPIDDFRTRGATVDSFTGWLDQVAR